jgi:monoamine oxidase
VLNKLFLRFERRFWPDMQERCVVLPETPEDRGYFSTWLNLEPLQGQPTLLSFAAGQAAAAMDRNEDDAAIVGRGLQRLRRLFGAPIPDPVGYRVTRWLSDPWALGSYSYAHVASPARDRELYAAPVGNRVFFAGEGTAAVDYGTVHAALLTGERAARQVHAALCCGDETTENLPYATWHRRRHG